MIGYAIEMKKDDSDWEVIAKECQCTSYTITNLIPNSIYLFRVYAINAYGFSSAGKASVAIKLIVNKLYNKDNGEQNQTGIDII